MTTQDESKPAPLDHRFGVAKRLRSSVDIARVFAAKTTSAGGSLVIHLSDNGLGWSRLCVIASRRVGNAVRRNAIRRRLREVFRRNQHALPNGFDIVCVVRPGAEEVYADLEDWFCSLAAKAAHKAHRSHHS